MTGLELRQELEWNRLAWQTAHLMNVHLKRNVTVRQLLGKDRTMTKEDKAEQFERLKAKLNRRDGKGGD